MARQRFIWPEIWKDPVFGRLQPTEQVCFIGLFSIADDEGRLLADPAYLRSELFPYKDITAKKMLSVRDAVVEKVDSVLLYKAGGHEYIALLKWSEYQKPKYPKPSKLPPPFPEASPNVPGSLPENRSVGRAGLGRDGKGRAGLGEPAEESSVENHSFVESRAVIRLLAAIGDHADSNTEATIRRLVIRYGLAEGDLEWGRECCLGPGVENRAKVAVAELKRRGEGRAA